MTTSEKDKEKLLVDLAIGNSEAAGVVFGIKVVTCEFLPDGFILFCYPDRPEDAKFFKKNDLRPIT